VLSTLCRSQPSPLSVEQLGLRRGVVKAAVLASIDQAELLRREAERQAQAIVCAARSEAEALGVRSRREARELMDKAERGTKRMRTQILKDAEAQIWRRFEELSTQWRQHVEQHRQVLEQQSLPVLRKAVAIIAGEAPAEARLRRGVQALLDEVGEAPGAALYVNERDHAQWQATSASLPWPLKADDSLPSGACRLVAAHGEWESSFEGRLERVMAVLRQVPAAEPAQAEPPVLAEEVHT